MCSKEYDGKLNAHRLLSDRIRFQQACFKHLVSEHPIICFFLMVSYRDGSKPSKPIHTIICSCCFHSVSCTNIQHLSSILACLGWQAKDSHWCTAPPKPRPQRHRWSGGDFCGWPVSACIALAFLCASSSSMDLLSRNQKHESAKKSPGLVSYGPFLLKKQAATVACNGTVSPKRGAVEVCLRQWRSARSSLLCPLYTRTNRQLVCGSFWQTFFNLLRRSKVQIWSRWKGSSANSSCEPTCHWFGMTVLASFHVSFAQRIVAVTAKWLVPCEAWSLWSTNFISARGTTGARKVVGGRWNGYGQRRTRKRSRASMTVLQNSHSHSCARLLLQRVGWRRCEAYSLLCCCSTNETAFWNMARDESARELCQFSSHSQLRQGLKTHRHPSL